MKKYILTFSFCICLLGIAYGQKTVEQLNFGPKQKENISKPLDYIIAIVGNDIITKQEINRFPKKNRKIALQRLIMQKLLLQTAKKYNIKISDTELNIAIENKKTAKLSRQELRNKIIIDKLQQMVASRYVQISDMEIDYIVNKQLKQSNDIIKIVDVLISVPKSNDPKILNQAQEIAREVEQALKSQSGYSVAAKYKNVNYNDLGWVEINKIPPLFAKVLVDAPLNKYSKPIIDRDGIHILKIVDKKHNNNKAKISEFKVAHILIKNKNNKQARKAINSIYKMLKEGADFAIIATNYSQDTNSAINGGDLGWVRNGQTVPTFEKVMKKTGIGNISKPFKSRFGYHILKVYKHRQITVNNRQILESQARNQIFQSKANQEWDLWLSRLRQEAYVKILDNNL